MLPSSAVSIFYSLLALFSPPSSRLPLELELRHLHAVSPDGHVVFSDIPQQPNLAASYSVNTRILKSHRPSSFQAFSHARIQSLRFAQSTPLHWEEDDVLGPDVEDRESLLVLAKMTNNAYLKPEDAQWYDLGANWTAVCPPNRHRLTSSLNPPLRHTQSAGNQTKTASEVTYLPLQTTPRLSSASKEPLQASLAAAVPRPRKINVTITCSSAVAVRKSAGLGRLCVDAGEEGTSVIRIV